MNPFLAVLLLYGFFLAVLGLLLARRVRTTSDFFVAGRGLGPRLLFSTLLAANIGAGSTVGAAGLAYELGLSAWWWVGSAGLGSFILAFWVGPRIRDLAERHGFLTVGDFLEFRYNRSVRVLVALLLWAGSLFILAGQILAFAWILSVVAGTGKAAGCFLGGLVVVIYFTAGGLPGAARINFLQLFVKGAGFLLAVPLVLWAVGGFEGLQNRILGGGSHDGSYFQLTGIGAGGILGYLLLLGPSFFVSPGLLQKVYGARDGRSVRLGAGANAVALLLFSFFPVLLGMAAAAAFPGLEQRELALPMVMTGLLPFWLGALLLAAVFSAEISSADAILFMLSTSLSQDLYRTFVDPKVSEERLLRLSRWISLSSGGVAMILAALLLPSVIAALTIFYSLLAVALTVPLLFGLYASFAGTRACLAAILISLPATLVIHLVTEGQGMGFLSPTAAGILISAAVVIASENLKRKA